MISLVLEGGSFRAIFSAGVMDALLDHGIMVDYCIGASAGISNGVSYISKQPKRNLDVFTKYRNDTRYIGRRNLVKQRSIFGLDFVYNQVPNQLVKFDWKTYRSYKGKVVVVTTNALTGKPEYMDGLKMDKSCNMLRATCALPLVFPAIMINDTPYFDGGLSDPIPIRKAIADGCDKHIIILTRPYDYLKDVSKEAKIVAKVYRHKYPKITEDMLNRHIAYNETTKFIKELENEKKAIVFRPERPIESFEKNVDELTKSYQMGYDMAVSRMDEIKQYLKNE
ncbi:MAG: patatin family protein [bacterium]|nr:patatin family protein [bacterium]